MNDELKPCPVCNTTDSLNIYNTVFGRNVKCWKCLIYMPIEKWNTRPIEDKLKAENENMREALDKCNCLTPEEYDKALN